MQRRDEVGMRAGGSTDPHREKRSDEKEGSILHGVKDKIFG